MPYGPSGTVEPNNRLRYDEFDVVTQSTGGEDGNIYQFGTAGCDGIVPGSSVAVFGNIGDDPQPWLWMPSNAVIAVGVTLGTDLTAGSFGVRLELEYKTSVENKEDILAYNLSTIDTTNAASYSAVSIALASDAKGAWVRPAGVVLTSGAEATTLRYEARTRVILAVGLGKTLPTFSNPSSGNLPQINGLATAQTAFLPAVNLSAERSNATVASAVILAASRITGLSLRMENVTKVMNIEGTITCLRFYEKGRTSLSLPPVSMTGFNEFDRYFGRAAAGVYTAVRPGTTFDRLIPYRFDSALGTNLHAVPCLNLNMNDQLHLIRVTDADTSTPSGFACTLRLTLEFPTNDALLRPGVARDSIEALHKAVRAFAQMRPFQAATSATPTTLVDNRPIGRPRKGKKGKAKPAEKPQAPKPKAEKKGKANGKKKGQGDKEKKK